MENLIPTLELMIQSIPSYMSRDKFVFYINSKDHLKLCLETKSLMLSYRGVKIKSKRSVRRRFVHLIHILNCN